LHRLNVYAEDNSLSGFMNIEYLVSLEMAEP